MTRRTSRPSEQESIEARAAAWIAQRDAGLSTEEAAEFAAWRARDRRHAAAVARLEHVWNALHELRDFRPSAHAHPDPDLLAPARARRVLRFPVLGALTAVAAVLVIGLMVARHLTVQSSVEPPPAAVAYATTAGGYQRVSLPDGSMVELNASTELQVDYTAAERRVMLARGEAHFTVAPNPQRPFCVYAGNIAVRAVGTAFDVRRETAAVEVLVTAGRVRLDRDSTALALGQEQSVLAAGWRAVVSHDARPPRIEKLALDTVRDALRWQSSRLVFVDTPLSEVVEEFNRHNEVQLVLADTELGALPIGGSFSAENLESFVRLLASNGDVRVERPSPSRIVLSRGR